MDGTSLPTPFEDPLVVSKYTQDVHDGLYEFEETFLKISKAYDHRKPRFLCLGCGAGREVFPLAKRGYEVLGIDGSQRLINAAQTFLNSMKLNAECRVATLPPLPNDISLFTCVIATYNFFSHISSLSKLKNLLEQVRDHLEPEGQLIFSYHERQKDLPVIPGEIGCLKSVSTLKGCASPLIPFRVFSSEEILGLANEVGFRTCHVISIKDLVTDKSTIKWSQAVMFASVALP